MATGDKRPVVMEEDLAAPGGVATLDADGKLLPDQRPSATDMGSADLLLSNLSDPAAARSNIGAASLEQTMQGAVPYGKELTGTWAELQTRIKAGDFTGICIGDYKTITLTTGETVIMEVAGIDQYYKCADTAIGHHVDFISRDCLAGAKQMNSTATNNGTEAEPNPWRASALFAVMNDETTGVYSTLPADLKPCIMEKWAYMEYRYSASGSLTRSNAMLTGYVGKLWLPMEVEVFDHPHWSQIGMGTSSFFRYPIFSGGTKHIIKGSGNGGARCNWWLASARVDNAIDFCDVASIGAGSGLSAETAACAPLCFRIG